MAGGGIIRVPVPKPTTYPNILLARPAPDEARADERAKYGTRAWPGPSGRLASTTGRC
jgi:hypothetical protein